MIVWVIVFICAAALLAVGVDWLMRRFGVTPADPEAARGGMDVLAERIREWSTRRRNR